MANHPILALILRIIAAALSFAFSVLAARVLGLENFGYFNIAIAFINLGVVLSLLGYETQFTRIAAVTISPAANTAKVNALKRRLRKASNQVWGMGIIITLTIIIALRLVPINGGVPMEMSLLIPILLFTARTRLSQGVIRGAHKAALSVVPDGILRPSVAIVGFLVMLGTEVHCLVLLIVIMLFAAVVAFGIGIYFETISLNIAHTSENNSKAISDTSSSSEGFPKAIYASSILAVFSSQWAVIAIGYLATPDQAGMYAAAERFALAASLIGQSVYLAIASKIAAFYNGNDQNSLRLLVRKTTRRVSLATLLLCIAMILASVPLLNIYGKEFVAARSVFTLLVISTLVNVGAGPVGILLLMTKNEKRHLLALIASVALQIFLFPLFVPTYGMFAGAVIILTSTLLWNALMCRFVNRELNLKILLLWA